MVDELLLHKCTFPLLELNFVHKRHTNTLRTATSELFQEENWKSGIFTVMKCFQMLLVFISILGVSRDLPKMGYSPVRKEQLMNHFFPRLGLFCVCFLLTCSLLFKCLAFYYYLNMRIYSV